MSDAQKQDGLTDHPASNLARAGSSNHQLKNSIKKNIQ